MSKKKESFFWTSYSDLMTSLFFIMLTLFILAIVLLNRRMKATQAELEQIKAIQESTKELEQEEGYFEYNEAYEKYKLKIDVFFPELQTDFEYLSPMSLQKLDAAGDDIVEFLGRHQDNKYLLIIEGQASTNSQQWMDRNYSLSFERAKNLMKYWLPKFKQEGEGGDPLQGNTLVQNCEIQIAGSGDGRLNVNSMRDPIEEKNQRFLIYIIPKNIMRKKEKHTAMPFSE